MTAMTNIPTGKLPLTRNSTAKKTPHQKKTALGTQKKRRHFLIFKDEKLVKSLLMDREISRLVGNEIEIHTKVQLDQQVVHLDKNTPITVFHIYEGNPSVGEKPHREYKSQLRGNGFKAVSGCNIQCRKQREQTIFEIKSAVLKLVA